MNRNFLVLIVTAAAVVTGASAFAGEIYRYVDEDGGIHYLDRPTGESGEERLDVTYTSTNNASVSAQTKQRQEYMAARDEARKDATSRREADEKARAELERREAALALADAQRVPDLELGVGWRRLEDGDGGAGADAFVFAAGLPLPLFDRNQGARQAALHERNAATDERRGVELALERELAALYSDLARAHAQAKAIENTILPAANKAFEISREGYLQGRFGYLDLLDAQRTLFETRGKYVENLRIYHQAVADIERLTSVDPDVNLLHKKGATEHD